MGRDDFIFVDRFEVTCCFGTTDWGLVEVPSNRSRPFMYNAKRCIYCGKFYVRLSTQGEFMRAHDIPAEEILNARSIGSVQASETLFRDQLRTEPEEVRQGVESITSERLWQYNPPQNNRYYWLSSPGNSEWTVTWDSGSNAYTAERTTGITGTPEGANG